MKKNINIIVLLLILLGMISCPGLKGPPDSGPKNIEFTPKSGKPGDIVTITGDDFLSPEDMELYLTDRALFSHKYESKPLILFNANIYNTDEGEYMQLHIEGTPAVDYIEFDTNKIVCRVPEGAKTGKIWVNGAYTANCLDLHHPSVEIFKVYDESGDIVM